MAMAGSLSEALEALVGEAPPVVTPPGDTDTSPDGSTGVRGQIDGIRQSIAELGDTLALLEQALADLLTSLEEESK